MESTEYYLKELLAQKDLEILMLKKEVALLRFQLEQMSPPGLQQTVAAAASVVETVEEKSDREQLELALVHEAIHQNQFEEEFQLWKVLFVNQYNKYRLKPQNKEQYWFSRESIAKVMFSWFTRMQNIRRIPILTVKLSLFLNYYGCSKPVWNLFSKLKLVLSYKKTKQMLLVAQQLDVPKLLNWTGNNTVGLIGADNCAYYNSSQYERDIAKVKFINTINWYHRFEDRSSSTEYHDDDVPLLEESADITHEFWYSTFLVPRFHVNRPDSTSFIPFPRHLSRNLFCFPFSAGIF
jgi:hypothetical protein